MLRKFASSLAVLCYTSFALAQPDPEPGMAVIPRDPRIVNVPAPATPEQIRAATREAYNKLLNPVGKLDLSSPEATVRSFAWSFYSGDVKTARECIQEAQPYEKLGEVEKLLQTGNLAGPGSDETRVLLTDVHSYVRGEDATVTLRLIQIFDPRIVLVFGIENPNPTGHIFGSCERLHLKKINGKWLIAEKFKSADYASEEERVWGEDLLARMTSLLTNPEQMTVRATVSQCQSNLKQIALGVMQFVQDWDERFALHADWKNQLQPYLKNEAIFRCPEVEHPEESYSFSSELENRSLNEIKEPVNTIMIYEGKDGKFDFRHLNNTKTNIAFADGHIKAYTKETLENAMKIGEVRWKP